MQQSGRALRPVWMISGRGQMAVMGFAIGLERPYLASSEHD